MIEENNEKKEENKESGSSFDLSSFKNSNKNFTKKEDELKKDELQLACDILNDKLFDKEIILPSTIKETIKNETLDSIIKSSNIEDFKTLYNNCNKSGITEDEFKKIL